MPKLVVLRVDRSGNVVGGNAAARERVDGAQTRICHRLVGAESFSGPAVCRPGCAWELGVGLAEGHDRLPVSVDGMPAHLTCQRVEEGVVVVLEPARPLPAARTVGARTEGGVFLGGEDLDLLRGLARGDSLADLALLLGARESTIRGRLRDLCRRLGVRTRAQAVAWAVASGQLVTEEP